MVPDLIEVLLLALRGALIAGLCWGAWLCLGERADAARDGNKLPLERYATLAALILLLTAFGGVSPAA